MPFKDRQNLAQEIAEHIGEKIIRMEMAPGERIMEARISEEFNVSRSPVREAMRILERFRLVELNPRRGATVTQMSEQYVGWLFDIMSDLLCLTARLCAENRTPEQLERLIEHEKAAAALAADGDSAGYLRAFYETSPTALKATGNPLLGQVINDWIPSLRRAYFLSLSHSTYSLQESAATMRRIIQHIAKGNPDAAAKTMQSLVRAEKKRVLDILRGHPVLDSGQARDRGIPPLRPG
jgi:DNA-binding GntR family transcriptional regulator